MVKLFTKTFSLFFIALWFFTAGVQAQTLKVAIAANLQPVMKALKKDFKLNTGINIDVISGSSGNLAAQIRNGAPYDVFLSADRDFPQTLQRDGLTIKDPVVYAQGVLIICSTHNLSLANWNGLLLTDNVKKIAIGNPAIAPYGKAAQQAIIKAGIYDKVQTKIVFGESISQVNTYIITGVVQAGFTTLSLVKDQANKQKLFYSLINPKNYAPIEQAMVLLKHSAKNAAAEKFYQYILSPRAKNIFKAYGYHTL
ncbi:molybdate ABC transporter substrate-binding protein [Mucilaginibacter terrigena]|uniref:Molybdate ABC transporter substrate-binding protein n=1 Tax=Mucilaginibacter terrigena TaxID=2492395 RepID=A0A4Q5LJH7_9SPHI|nr:molybdate ABC transporter substrate-binding protein [Mucilaginibacter terrigena]RYU89455.1 molybdate ABC transporter substrate-binding protein [Mucilaginibacter terrigena]